MKKAVAIVGAVIIVIVTLVIVPWGCRRRVHYNWAYRGKVEKQIETSKVIKSLEKRVSVLEAAAGK